MENRPLISVIIPVYNSEKYLVECLNSLRYQVYENLEFICVNDGSNDNSLKILEEYKNLDKRFIIINQKNQGAAKARNVGIEYAKGEYISFIDSDDRVSLCLYQKFVNATPKADIFLFNVCQYDKNAKEILPRYFFSLNEWLNHKDEYTVHSFKDCINPFRGNMSAVNKIYKADFINRLKSEYGELFPVGTVFEDQFFYFVTLFNSASIMISSDPLYYYRNSNSNSITKNISTKVLDIFNVIDKIENLLRKKDLYQEYKYAFFQHKYRQYSYLFMLADDSLKDVFYKEMQTRMAKYRSENLNPMICERLTHYGIYKNILRLNAKEFFEKYKGKI